MDCFCILTNGNIYHLFKGKLYTKYKEKATDKFYFSHEYFDDYYVCPIDQILPEIEEAFDYRFFALCDVFGKGDVEWVCNYDENGVVFEDSIFVHHDTWVVYDRDTIVKKIPYSEVTEFITYKDTFIKDGIVFEEKQVERIVLSKDEWLDLRQKFDRSKI